MKLHSAGLLVAGAHWQEQISWARPKSVAVYSSRMEEVQAGSPQKKFGTPLDLCVSSLRRGHANLLCIVPILSDDPRRESNPLSASHWLMLYTYVYCIA